MLSGSRPCGDCGVLVVFRQKSDGRWVCLEAEPWDARDRLPLFWLGDGGVAHSLKDEMNVTRDSYPLHTARPNHGHFRRSA